VSKAIVTEGQSIYDVALQEYGSAEAVFDLLKDNNLTLDTTLVAGQELSINEAHQVKKAVVQFYLQKNHRVNTNNSKQSGDFDANDFNNDFLN
jgi:hypothetical protein